MSRPLVVLRPEPGLADTVASARVLGLDAVASPLFAIQPVSWRVPDSSAFDAILAGSANAFRCGGAGLAQLTSLPVHAVGERTADAAGAVGFTVAAVGAGGLQVVLGSLAAPARLLRLAGEQRVPLTVPRGIAMTECVVYRAAPLPLSPDAALALRRGAVALLHSAEAAVHFAAECDRLELHRGAIAVAALGNRIAAAAGEGWQAVAAADRPTDERLLALARRMCQ